MENNIGTRLREYIDYCYNSIKEFSKLTGVSQNQLSFYLNNVRIPGGEILKKFADTGCNINWLLTGKGEMLIMEIECRTTVPKPLFIEDGTPDFINIEFLSQTAPPWLYYYSFVSENNDPDIYFKENDLLILRKITKNDPMFDLSDNESPRTDYVVWFDKEYNSKYGTLHGFGFMDCYEDDEDSDIMLGRDYSMSVNSIFGDLDLSEEAIIKAACSVEYLIRPTVTKKDPFASFPVKTFVNRNKIIRSGNNTDDIASYLPFSPEKDPE